VSMHGERLCVFSETAAGIGLSMTVLTDPRSIDRLAETEAKTVPATRDGAMAPKVFDYVLIERVGRYGEYPVRGNGIGVGNRPPGFPGAGFTISAIPPRHSCSLKAFRPGSSWKWWGTPRSASR
jgi:hypothetical protein